MSVYLYGKFQSANDMECLILVVTTAVLTIYLLFQMAQFVEHVIKRSNKKDQVVTDMKEIRIDVANRSYEFNLNKIKEVFWKLIVISFVIGVVLCFTIVVVIPLAIIVILLINKGLNSGVFKGIRSVLRIALSK